MGIVTFNEWFEGTQIEPAIPYSNSSKTFLDYTPDVSTMYIDKTASWVGVYDAANSGLIQAENYNSSSSTVSTTTCSEGGNCVASPSAGNWLCYTGISISSAGNYQIRVRSASTSVGGSIQICDGSTSNVIATVTIPVTGSSSLWRTTSATVTLTAGTHTLYILDVGGNSGDFSLNWFDVRPVLAAPVIPQVGAVTYSPVPGTYASPQSVALSCATTGSSIRYNVTGSGSYLTPYSSPLFVSGNTTVSGIGYLPGYLLSAPTYGAYNIAESGILRTIRTFRT